MINKLTNLKYNVNIMYKIVLSKYIYPKISNN